MPLPHLLCGTPEIHFHPLRTPISPTAHSIDTARYIVAVLFGWAHKKENTFFDGETFSLSKHETFFFCSFCSWKIAHSIHTLVRLAIEHLRRAYESRSSRQKNIQMKLINFGGFCPPLLIVGGAARLELLSAEKNEPFSWICLQRENVYNSHLAKAR